MPIQIDLGHGASGEDKKSARTGAVIGIDLGTTNSLAAFQGKVLKEAGDDGMLPSALLVNEAGKVELVGKAARAERARRAGNVLYSIKRLMGRSLADVQSQRASIPFELAEESGSVQVRVRVGERNFSPVELSAEILRALKQRAERVLGREVDRAVITVPAYFDDAQRQATKAAGKVAGLDVLRVMNEPTAAALAYGWTEGRNGVVAVYDLGGGTFDLSLLRLHENVFEVLATAGDTQLGGDDFDHVVAEQAAKQLKLEIPAGEAERQSWWGAMLFEGERVKRALGELSEVDFNVELGGKKHGTRIKLSDVQPAWQALIARSLQCCQRALRDAHMPVGELSDVLLVGGSTRMPLVREEVGKFFGRAPNTTLNPDEAVALGAALQADVLAGNASDRLLLDVIPLSLGIETMGGVVSKLISRNSTIPVEARENYTNHADGQTAFDIHVLQGERELVRDCRSLARFKLRGLQPAPAGYHRIEVLFRVDANGILNVRATDLRTNKKHEIEVRPSFGISDDELFKMLESSYDHAESDMQARQIAEARVEAQTVVAATEKALKNAGHLLESLERSEVSARLIDLKNAANGSDPQAITAAIGALDEVGKPLAELQVNAALEALRNKRPDQV